MTRQQGNLQPIEGELPENTPDPITPDPITPSLITPGPISQALDGSTPGPVNPPVGSASQTPDPFQMACISETQHSTECLETTSPPHRPDTDLDSSILDSSTVSPPDSNCASSASPRLECFLLSLGPQQCEEKETNSNSRPLVETTNTEQQNVGPLLPPEVYNKTPGSTSQLRHGDAVGFSSGASSINESFSSLCLSDWSDDDSSDEEDTSQGSVASGQHDSDSEGTPLTFCGLVMERPGRLRIEMLESNSGNIPERDWMFLVCLLNNSDSPIAMQNQPANDGETNLSVSFMQDYIDYTTSSTGRPVATKGSKRERSGNRALRSGSSSMSFLPLDAVQIRGSDGQLIPLTKPADQEQSQTQNRSFVSTTPSSPQTIVEMIQQKPVQIRGPSNPARALDQTIIHRSATAVCNPSNGGPDSRPLPGASDCLASTNGMADPSDSFQDSQEHNVVPTPETNQPRITSIAQTPIPIVQMQPQSDQVATLLMPVQSLTVPGPTAMVQTPQTSTMPSNPPVVSVPTAMVQSPGPSTMQSNPPVVSVSTPLVEVEPQHVLPPDTNQTDEPLTPQRLQLPPNLPEEFFIREVTSSLPRSLLRGRRILRMNTATEPPMFVIVMSPDCSRYERALLESKKTNTPSSLNNRDSSSDSSDSSDDSDCSEDSDSSDDHDSSEDSEDSSDNLEISEDSDSSDGEKVGMSLDSEPIQEYLQQLHEQNHMMQVLGSRNAHRSRKNRKNLNADAHLDNSIDEEFSASDDPDQGEQENHQTTNSNGENPSGCPHTSHHTAAAAPPPIDENIGFPPLSAYRRRRASRSNALGGSIMPVDLNTDTRLRADQNTSSSSYFSSSSTPEKESPTENPESSSKHPETSSKHTESSAKHPESSSKHPETSSKHPESSAKYPGSSTQHDDSFIGYFEDFPHFPIVYMDLDDLEPSPDSQEPDADSSTSHQPQGQAVVPCLIRSYMFCINGVTLITDGQVVVTYGTPKYTDNEGGVTLPAGRIVVKDYRVAIYGGKVFLNTDLPEFTIHSRPPGGAIVLLVPAVLIGGSRVTVCYDRSDPREFGVVKMHSIGCCSIWRFNRTFGRSLIS